MSMVIWSDTRVVRVDHVTSGRRCLLRKVISGEVGWSWEERRVGRSRFTTASGELLPAFSSASPWPLFCHLLFWRTRRDGGCWLLKSSSIIWFPLSSRRESKSVSTPMTSSVSSFGRMSPSGTLYGTEWWTSVTSLPPHPCERSCFMVA